jgi:transcriptional regulator with XRE-family HTH domain
VPPTETIGERLRRLREDRGLTQRDLASPGVSAQYVSRIEHGDRNPSVKALRKLATRLGVSAELLESGQDSAATELRAFRLADAELALRLREDPATLEATFETLLEEASGADDAITETRAALGLGTLAAHRGEHDRAITLLESAVRAPWVTPRRNADAYATLGHSLVAAGRDEEAIALFRACVDELTQRPPVDDVAITRFATYLSYALVDNRSLEEARRANGIALRHGQASDDLYTRIRLHWASARLAASAGDLEFAELSITRAITLLETSEDTGALGRAHLVAAEIALWESNYTDAADHLATAERLLPEGCALEDRVFLLIQHAFVAARTGQAPRAMDAANQAIQLLGSHTDATIRGRAHWALAEAYAAAGAFDSARAAFSRAGELIPPGSKHSNRLLEAWQLAVPS